MKLREFYQRVLPPTGNYVLATEDGRFSQAKAEHMDALENMTQRAIDSYKNVYFGTGTYKDGKREAKNTTGKKALYLDMDCGGGKEFPTKKDAVVQLKEFIHESKFINPNILVDSGNGIHAYWTLDKVVPASEWVEMAETLKKMCHDFNFPADDAVTADSARILRVPGSINKKDTQNPKTCRVLKSKQSDFPVTAIKKLLARHQAPKATVPLGLPDVDVNDLSNATLEKRDWYAKYIFKECPTLKDIKDTGGANCNEPLWMQTLNLLAYCADGADYIHPVSNGHKGYDSRMTERKFNARVEKKTEGSTGPTLCKTFAMYPQAKCASCPHNGEIKSPISLGKEPPPPPEEMPRPYKQDHHGIYYEVEGQRVSVCDYRIEKFELRQNPLTGTIERHVEFSIGKMGQRYKYLGTKESMANELVALKSCGVFVQDHHYKMLKNVMNTWAQQLQNAKKVSTLSGKFGWQGTDFVSGGNIYHPDGTVTEAPIADPVIQTHYSIRGDLDKWKEAAKYVTDGEYTEMQSILASSFAAPLMHFTNVSGTILSVISKQSGTGKTSAMRTAQAVWGDPIHGINALNDTANSVSHRMGILNNLPLYWDELRQRKDVSDFITFVFRAGQGRDKTRLNKSSEQMASGGWHTLITAASNEPLKDHVDANISTTNAGMLRIFEMEINHTKNQVYNPAANRTFKALEKNYGLAGDVYARYIVANRKTVSKMIHDMETKLSKEIGADQNERFWVTTMAVLLVGAAIAKKLDLVDFDMSGLKAVLISTVEDMRDASTTSVNMAAPVTSEQLVQEFINAKTDHVYITDTFPDQNGNVGQFVKIPDRSPVLVYMSLQEKRMRIDKAAFKGWLKEQGMQPLSIIRQLVKNGAVDRRADISPKYGTGAHASSRAYVLEMNTP